MLGIVAIAVSGVSLLLNIVGLAIPYWLYFSEGDVTSNMGLWTSCNKNPVVDKCSDIDGGTSSLKATRALELLGMLLLVGTLVCAALKLLVMKDKALLWKLAGILAAVAGTFMILGCIVFAVKAKEDMTGYDLHAGFALCIVAGVGSIAAFVLFVINKDDK